MWKGARSWNEDIRHFWAENNHFLDDNPNRGLRGFIIFTDFPNLTKETIKAQFDEAVNKRFDTR